MELTLVLNEKETIFRTGKITVRMFRRATEVRKAFIDEKFLGENYPATDLDEAVQFIVEYFGNQFSVDDFYDGFMISDAQDLMVFFFKMLNNIQTNEEKFKVAEDASGK